MITWLTIKDESITLSLYIQPGAKSTQISGLHGESLKIRLAAPPVEGKANTALISFLAKIFSVAKNKIYLDSGSLSRHKIITIEGHFKQEDILKILHYTI